MSIFCIPKFLVDSFLGNIKSGKINPTKLAEMSSKERRGELAKYVGEKNAEKTNALFESKLLLKNQQAGLVSWAKKIAGLTPQVKRDIISRIEKMTEVLNPATEDAFLSDLVAHKLGTTVTMAEAAQISSLSQEAVTRKAKIDRTSAAGSKSRMEFGIASENLTDYVKDLKIGAGKLTAKEMIRHPGNIISEVSGAVKSAVSSLDNSFFGRQGWMTLMTRPGIWSKNFAKSFGDMGKEIRGIDGMKLIRADIVSRENALNGKYKAIALEVNLSSEEAFPSALPERIPGLGRLYKASETAFNGAALRMRVDIADRAIAAAEANGVNVMDKNLGLGRVINSMTGRGAIEVLSPEGAKVANTTVFSIKNFKAQVDMITFHAFDRKTSPYAKKVAAKNIVRAISTVAGIMAVAKALDPDSIELDPRGTNWGNIMVGKNHDIPINITGGLNTIAKLAARVIVPTKHNGEWGWWSKNQYGIWRKLGGGDSGANPFDVAVNFMKNKASPMTGFLLNIWKGTNFEGDELSLGKETAELGIPLSVQNASELLETSAGEKPLLYAILSALDFAGFGVNARPKNLKSTVSAYKMITKEINRLENVGDKKGAKELKENNALILKRGEKLAGIQDNINAIKREIKFVKSNVKLSKERKKEKIAKLNDRLKRVEDKGKKKFKEVKDKFK